MFERIVAIATFVVIILCALVCISSLWNVEIRLERALDRHVTVAEDVMKLSGRIGEINMSALIGTGEELTPMPRPVYTTLKPSTKHWPVGDANEAFEQDDSLPLLAIITINAQLGQGGMGVSERASWIHKLSYHNKLAYCRKWGYDLIIEDSEIVDKSRDVAWSKIPAFKKWLPKYQWLMWVDMDAFFMNFKVAAHNLLSDDYDLIIAKDWNGINMGVYFMKNSPFSYELMNSMWNAPKTWWYPWEEQSSLMHLMDATKNGNRAKDILEHINFPAQRDMNSYGAEMAYGNQQALYREGDYIAHFPNCKGFHTCRATIEQHYERMLTINNLPPFTGHVPLKLLPVPR